MTGLMYETHSHTPLCKHAVGQPEEYAAVAFERGLRGVVVTCHNPMPAGFSPRVRMSIDEFDEYVDMVARARDAWQGRVDVRLGLEADYFAGHESFLERQLSSAEFNYVLGSVHPQIAEFRQRYWNDDPVEVQRIYFRLLADAAETGLFDSLAHPDLIKNETADDWEPSRVMNDICRALDRIAATGVAMELNTSGVNKSIPEMNPFPGMLAQIAARGIPVVIGSDAHVPTRVADGFESALDLLAESGFANVSYFLGRTRQEIEIATARASLLGASCARCGSPDPTLPSGPTIRS
jgi:histidinol-phosphatase (PHP family)